MQEAENRLDEFLAQGREALDNLIDQRNVLKGTQRRLLDTANTLGLSRDVIGWIERRRCGSNLRFFFVQSIWEMYTDGLD
jgi:Golgi SNAP receptor complex protein 2